MRRVIAYAVLAAGALAGCGLAVQAPDLFAVTKAGQGSSLTMVVNDGGTISCNRGRAKPLSDRLLIVARSLDGQLEPDALKKIDPPSPSGSAYRYTVRMQQGTFSFPDTSAASRAELAKLEQFVLEAGPACAGGG